VWVSFWLQKLTIISIHGIKLQKKVGNLVVSIFLYGTIRDKIALPYTSPNLVQSLLSERLWAPLLYTRAKKKTQRAQGRERDKMRTMRGERKGGCVGR